MRFLNSLTTIVCAGVLLAACREAPTTARTPAPSFSTFGSGAALVVNVSRDMSAEIPPRRTKPRSPSIPPTPAT